MISPFETCELTDDVRGGLSFSERYQRWNAFGRCTNERYANARTGHRDLNPSWSCYEYLNGTR